MLQCLGHETKVRSQELSCGVVETYCMPRTEAVKDEFVSTCIKGVPTSCEICFLCCSTVRRKVYYLVRSPFGFPRLAATEDSELLLNRTFQDLLC